MKIVADALSILEGLSLTLRLLVCSITIGCVCGTGLLVLRYQNVWGRRVVQSITSVLRGVPMILQISLVYFSLPFQMSVFWTGVIALGINSAAYVAELLRSGLQAVPVGQWEAAQVLGIKGWSLWRRVLLPQVLRNSFPSLVNEVVALLKETSLVATIGGVEVMRKAQMVAAADYAYFKPLCIAGLYYYILVRCFECFGNYMMKKVSYD